MNNSPGQSRYAVSVISNMIHNFRSYNTSSYYILFLLDIETFSPAVVVG